MCTRDSFDEYISIAALERAASDFGYDKKKRMKKIKDKNKEVAIVGSGPAGLTCAYHLRRMGYRVTLFEKLQVLGGILKVGIPDYRLPKDILEMEISEIIGMGIDVKTNTELGRDLDIEELENRYDAVFMATGAHLNRRLSIPGEEFKEVISGLEFLRDVNLGKRVKIGKRVIIIGGGNTAFDAARSALRLGSKPTIIYRRSQDQMPAFIEEVQQGIEERRAVTIGHYEAIAIHPLRVDRIVRHEVVPQHFGNIGHSHGCAGVTGVGFLDRIHAQGTDRIGKLSA